MARAGGAPLTVETLTNRVLGAIRFLDAVTMVPVTRLLSVEGTGVAFFRNRRAVYVLTHVPGLEHHQRAFDQPPVTPALNSLSIQIRVRDPKGEYLPRVRSIQLPRDPSPANATQSDSLFQPIDILLYPAPTAKIAPGWAVIRASVTAQATGQPLSGALLRVERTSDAAYLAGGVSDSRGEALVAIPGFPAPPWEEGSGPVLTNEVGAILNVVFDPNAGQLPDPDQLEANNSTLPSSSISVALASGRTLTIQATVALP